MTEISLKSTNQDFLMEEGQRGILINSSGEYVALPFSHMTFKDIEYYGSEYWVEMYEDKGTICTAGDEEEDQSLVARKVFKYIDSSQPAFITDERKEYYTSSDLRVYSNAPISPTLNNITVLAVGLITTSYYYNVFIGDLMVGETINYNIFPTGEIENAFNSYREVVDLITHNSFWNDYTETTIDEETGEKELNMKYYFLDFDNKEFNLIYDETFSNLSDSDNYIYERDDDKVIYESENFEEEVSGYQILETQPYLNDAYYFFADEIYGLDSTGPFAIYGKNKSIVIFPDENYNYHDYEYLHGSDPFDHGDIFYKNWNNEIELEEISNRIVRAKWHNKNFAVIMDKNGNITRETFTIYDGDLEDEILDGDEDFYENNDSGGVYLELYVCNIGNSFTDDGIIIAGYKKCKKDEHGVEHNIVNNIGLFNLDTLSYEELYSSEEDDSIQAIIDEVAMLIRVDNSILAYNNGNLYRYKNGSATKITGDVDYLAWLAIENNVSIEWGLGCCQNSDYIYGPNAFIDLSSNIIYSYDYSEGINYYVHSGYWDDELSKFLLFMEVEWSMDKYGYQSVYVEPGESPKIEDFVPLDTQYIYGVGLSHFWEKEKLKWDFDKAKFVEDTE